MGTSSIFRGNNDKNPLLPSDYEEQTQQEEAQQEQIVKPVTWKAVKTNMSKYVNSNGTRGTAAHIIRQSIKANGGAHRMTMSSGSGIRSAINLGSFFAGIRDKGIYKTLLELGVDYQGKDIQEVLSFLINAMSEDSQSKNDIVAREASQAALSSIYDYLVENNLNLESLNHLPIELMDQAMKLFFAEFIWASIMKDLACRVEQYMQDIDSAYQREQELKGIIEAVVDVEYNKHGSLIDKNVQDAVHFLLERCLGVLEGIV